MAKTVGYACSIKLQWLNKAIQLLSDNLEEAAYKEKLNEYLAFEIDSPTRLRKTREILMNVWFYDSEGIAPIRQEALSLIEKYPDYAVPVHLCMIYLAYPIVADVCKFIGRIFEFQDEVTNGVLRQKLYDEWGERGTLETTTRRITLTLKEMDILFCETRTRYSLKKQTVINEHIINFILSVAMRIDGKSYYSFSDINAFSILFPFEYRVSKEQLMIDDRFVINTFGGELTISIKG